jgi:hypothetical protein
MTKAQKQHVEMLNRELDRFAKLQVYLKHLKEDCETEDGQNACVKVMEYVNDQINLLANRVLYEKESSK